MGCARFALLSQECAFPAKGVCKNRISVLLGELRYDIIVEPERGMSFSPVFRSSRALQRLSPLVSLRVLRHLFLERVWFAWPILLLM